VTSTFRLRAAVAALAVSLLLVPPAHAVNKDMVELQTQVQQLTDSVARLQQSNDERMGVLRDLVQQTLDSVNRMTTTVNTLQKQVQATQDTLSAKQDTAAGQVQSLNDSIDELKARLTRIEKSLNDVENQRWSHGDSACSRYGQRSSHRSERGSRAPGGCEETSCSAGCLGSFGKLTVSAGLARLHVCEVRPGAWRVYRHRDKLCRRSTGRQRVLLHRRDRLEDSQADGCSRCL
jgi:outer membrane murein-binding lipoprotein Lpp